MTATEERAVAVRTMSVTIDGHQVTVGEGTTIFDAARKVGVDIPVLCHNERYDPVGVCRMCVVDTGGRVFAAACVRPCEDGMEVTTSSPELDRSRATLTELLMSDQPPRAEDPKDTTTRDNLLLDLADGFGVARETTELPCGSGRGTDSSNPVIDVDHDACILCDRCVRACDDIQGNDVIGRSGKGYSTRIAFDLDDPMGASSCVTCGECVQACPTGALTNKPIRGIPIRPREELDAVDSVCPYCGVGCALTYYVDRERGAISFAEGRAQPGSQSRLCVKGRYGWDYAASPQRLTVPLIRIDAAYPKGPALRGRPRRQPQRPGPGERRRAQRRRPQKAGRQARRQAQARRSGRLRRGHALTSGRPPGTRPWTWWRAGCGRSMPPVGRAPSPASARRSAPTRRPTSSRSSSAPASARTTSTTAPGSATPPRCSRCSRGSAPGAVSTTYGDVVNADCVIITGSNPTANHPVASSFFKQARRRGTKVVYVDPRASTVAEHADIFVQLKPGTDVAFYNAVMHEIIRLGLVDREFIANRTSNYDELARTVADYPPERAAQITGVDADTIREVARTWGEAGAAVVYWGMGISQHTTGTDNARCLIALCSITGNVGRPGTGLHPLRGQNNVQGASDAGLVPMFYPGYQGVDVEKIRLRFEEAWGTALDPKRGLTVTEIIKSALEPDGVRGMYMLGENPFLSDPNINKVRKALSALDFLVVQDIFLTETAEFADVILPATSYLEKDGTYTNTDRRVQLGRKVMDPPGQARPDWEIVQDIARRIGLDWSYGAPSEVFDEMVALMPSYKNLRYDNLGLSGKLYPNADPEHTDGTIVMFDERFNTDDGLAHLVPAQWLPPKELPDAEYPLVLNTGRLLEHWHTGSMTRRSFALDAISPVAEVYMHPKDAADRGLAHGEMARVRSRRGTIELLVRVSHREQLGNCFIPFHFREAAANLLTIDEIDPFGKIPEFKFCAVQVEPLGVRA